MYNAYDGKHMPPVMSYTVGVMSSTEGVMTYRVDEMAVLTGFKSDIELVYSYTQMEIIHIPPSCYK